MYENNGWDFPHLCNGPLLLQFPQCISRLRCQSCSCQFLSGPGHLASFHTALRCPTSTCIFLGLVLWISAWPHWNVALCILQQFKPLTTSKWVRPQCQLVPQENHILWACGTTTTAPIRTLSTHVPLPQCPQPTLLCNVRGELSRNTPSDGLARNMENLMQIDVIHLLPRANRQTVWHLRSHDPSPDFLETGRRWNDDSAVAVHRD